MKKQYMTPETLLHQLQLQHIMTGSPFTTNSDGDLIGTTPQDGDATGPAMGRRRRRRQDDWDDEEEDW